MGQEQSYSSSVAPARRYKDKYEEKSYRGAQRDYRAGSYEGDYKRHKPRRSSDSFKSDLSSTESSGYRSGSSACECKSSKSDYYCTSLYKNDHYKDLSKELYKPVKISKDKLYHLKLYDLQREEVKSDRMKSYLNETDKSTIKSGVSQKTTGIRNYKPKILTEEEKKKKSDSWM